MLNFISIVLILHIVFFVRILFTVDFTLLVLFLLTTSKSFSHYIIFIINWDRLLHFYYTICKTYKKFFFLWMMLSNNVSARCSSQWWWRSLFNRTTWFRFLNFIVETYLVRNNLFYLLWFFFFKFYRRLETS